MNVLCIGVACAVATAAAAVVIVVVVDVVGCKIQIFRAACVIFVLYLFGCPESKAGNNGYDGFV